MTTSGTPQSPSTPRHNLPIPRSSFVGREQEMLEVERELARAPLLTLTGVGGSGKTRLALEAARELVNAYPDGVWFVGLAPLSERALVPKVVAEAVGVPERPGEALIDTLVDFLHSRRTLLILDNCEHLIETCAELVDTLLACCENLRVLATSREALGVTGETNWTVPSLAVPDAGALPDPEDLARYEAVRLFVERGKSRSPGFELTRQNAGAVAGVCRKLDGIPLAIELATARMGVLGVGQIAERLGDSPGFLTKGERTRAPRQRTLKGTLDWSYDLLPEPERVSFARLSVFVGGWTLEAAEKVAAGEGVDEDEILELLSELVEKSLVVAEPTEQGGVRHRLLEPVRQYALEKLGRSGEAEKVRCRHAGFFLDLAEEAEPRLRGPDDVEWFQRLEAEHDNLRAALSWPFERGETEQALRLAAALCIFWRAHGDMAEGRKWLEAALAEDDRTSVAARMKALMAMFWLTDQWDLDRAEAVAKEGLKLSKEAEIGGSFAASLRIMMAAPLWSQGDYERAKELLEESLALSREADDKVMIAEALLRLGRVPTNPPGDTARAKQIYEEGIALCREAGYAFRLPVFLLGLGYVLLLEGDYERGAALNEEAAALCRDRGYNDSLPYALDNLGWATLLQGDHERARTFYKESLTLCGGLGDKMIASESLDGLACVAGAAGEAGRTARLFGAAEAQRLALREAVGYQHSPREDAWRKPYLAAARSRLGKPAWRQALAQGQAMELKRAIEYALSEEEPPTATLSSAPEHPAGLTSRELEVLGLVAGGITSAQIAKQLYLSPRTVETHLTSIYHKLGVNSRAAATRFALEHGLA